MTVIKVIGDRVLVALPPREDETVSAGGIVLVKDPDRFYAPTRGIVMQLGEKGGTVDLNDAIAAINDVQAEPNPAYYDSDCKHAAMVEALSALAPAPFDVVVGDCVLFPQSVGQEFTDDGIDYVVLREAEIIGIVEPFQKDTAA